MLSETYAILLFSSTRAAMAAEKEGKAAGFTVRIIPTPAQIISTCGFSLRCPCEEQAELTAHLKAIDLAPSGAYTALRQGLTVTYKKCANV